MTETHPELYPEAHFAQVKGRLLVGAFKHQQGFGYVPKRKADVKHKAVCIDGPWQGNTIVLTTNATMWFRLGERALRYVTDPSGNIAKAEYRFGRCL